jgi:thiol-disulfide isomerase/thioredoxin
MARTLALVLLLALLTLVFFWPKAQDDPALPVPPAEAAALQQLLTLKLADAQQQTIDPAKWQGRIRVINLWATWCLPCKEEMPAFSRLQDAFQDKEVQFVGIAVDSPANVQAFSAKYPVSYPLPIGDDRVLPLSRALGNLYMGLPFTLVVGKEGEILIRKSGRYAEAELATLLTRLTQNAPPMHPVHEATKQKISGRPLEHIRVF